MNILGRHWINFKLVGLRRKQKVVQLEKPSVAAVIETLEDRVSALNCHRIEEGEAYATGDSTADDLSQLESEIYFVESELKTARHRAAELSRESERLAEECLLLERQCRAGDCSPPRR